MNAALPAPMIAARELGKRYGGVRVFEDATFAIAPGARIALTGANGAGKSTLLAVLATLAAPSAGEAWIDAHPVSRGSSALRRAIGVLAHRPMLYEELTPRENLRFFARLYDVPRADERGEALLRALGLWRRRDEPTAVLSRGLHQRLAIARALVHRPAVLLLDEPETGLDAEGLALLDELMLCAPGVTVLAATHRLDRVARWADGALHCERGRITASGAAAGAAADRASAGAPLATVRT
ncbi:MAG: ABC transporter ATP-binding protein [Dehalococcoidia bacterium]|nr:ABC transporter ATP-binding protein [Dehalococcoidia bacterium]